MNETHATALLAAANEICRDIPTGYEIRLCMENGAAWVTLHNSDGDLIELPDAADKTLAEQLNDAVHAAILDDESLARAMDERDADGGPTGLTPI